jgi:hypothetical protein
MAMDPFPHQNAMQHTSEPFITPISDALPPEGPASKHACLVGSG